ncbi:hypothetical protein NQ314_015251 [Rhamnusium bicolor]|uniref:Uncharacterized protein n=1 Tax=Rhamnusium bicolor TaxID=1586634 RepID=A0AAV8WYU1_9CUCU|nr:hypothetical protein NQ314_015251 [Rhamnusium bicolor]
MITTPIIEIKKCRNNNLQRGIKDVCGLLMNVWFPFDIDYFPMRQFFYMIQLYSIYNSYVVSSTISFSIVESMEHVIFRIKHVKALFVEALNEENYDKRRTLLNRCIKYHNFVIR